MKPSSREETLFQAAVVLTGAERAAFLDRECAGDPVLRARIQALLAAHEQPGTLFGTEAGASRPTICLEPAHDLSDDWVGQTIGRYKLREKIGEGGCGVVYVAEQTEPVRRRVAVKVIKLGMDTKQVVARFEAERQALAMMDHPNIAKVLDAGVVGQRSDIRGQRSEVSDQRSAGGVADALTSDFRPLTSGSGRPYFVMELVRGIRITDYCDQNRLGTKDRLDLFIKVCQAIQHAHQKGIIHRDIKPSNILVTLHDGVPVPKVIDFGIAKATEGRLTDATVYTQLHQFIGTPAYMSPEQAEMSGLDIDTRSDIYSLGVLLYELLTGTTPFDARDLMSRGIDAMRRTIREQEPVRPSTRLTHEMARLGSRANAIGPQSYAGAGSRGREPATPGAGVLPHESRPTGPQATVVPEVAEQRRVGLRERIKLIRGDLDWIVMKCLEKDRGRRYETANGLAADLKRHLNNEPVVACPPSAAYRFQKAFRRNRLAFTAGTVMVVTLVLGLGVSTWQWAKARQAESEKREQAQLAFQERDRASEAERQALAHLRQARRAAYLADMRLVADSLQSGNVGRARRILAEHRPGPDQEDLRDWEWFYFEALARADDSVEIGRHPGGARHLLDSQGNRFVTWGLTLPPFDSAGQIQIWDAARRRVLTGFAAPAGTAAVALSRDGKRLAVARGLEIEIRSLDAPQTVLTRLTNWHSGTSYGQPHRHGLRGGEYGCAVNLMRFVGDDTILAVARRSFTNEPEAPHPLTFIDVRKDAVVAMGSGEPVRSVLSMAVSADGRLLAVDTGDTDVVVLRPLERQTVAQFAVRTKRLPPDARSPMAFGEGNHTLLMAADGGRIALWDTASGQPVRPVGEHAPEVLSLAVTPDGRRLASFGVDHLIRVWDLASGSGPTRVLRGHTDEIWGGAFVAGDQFLVTCGRDQSVRSWDLRERDIGEERWELPSGHVYATLRFGVLGAVGRERRWTCWNVSEVGQTLEPRRVLPPPSYPGASVIPVPGTEYRLVVPEPDEPEPGEGLAILLYRGVEHPQPIAAFPDVRILSHHGIQHSHDTLLLHGRFQGEPQLLFWNLARGRLDRCVPTFTTEATAMAVSPDQRLVLLGDRAGTIECVDAGRNQSQRWPGALPGAISALVMLPDNRTVVAASRLGVLRKFDWPDRRLVLEEVPGSVAGFVSMARSPGGTRLVTGDAQGGVRLWDTQSLREIAVLGKHTNAVGGVRFQPDGQTLLSVDAHELRVWRGRSE